MGRRRQNEVGFESDSFLDIIANIVGILIILIVIAGVRVSNAPVRPTAAKPTELKSEAATFPAEVETMTAEDQSEETETPFIFEDTIENESAEPVVAELETPDTSESDPPLEPEFAMPTADQLAIVDQRVERATHRLAELDEALTGIVSREKQFTSLLAEQKTRGEELAQQRAELAAREEKTKASLQETLALLDTESEHSQGRIKQLLKEQEDVNQLRNQISEIDKQIGALENSATSATVIRHKLTPVSQVVEGKEIHFMISGGRISYVPIEDLLELLAPQIERRRDWLVKHHQHRGRVGPVRGFMLDYVVQAFPGSALTSTVGVMRIHLAGWQVVPTDDIEAETAEEAARTRSNFYLALREAGSDATLTFWVYPDSYATFRSMQDFAYRQGFQVAARPMPEGVPIAGSPQGSKSAGQ